MDEVAKYAQGSEPLYASLGNSQGKGGDLFFLQHINHQENQREKQYQEMVLPQDLATGKSALFKIGQ